MSEHTPTPWKAEQGAGKQWNLVPHYDEYDRRSVATFIPVSGKPSMDAEANARFTERACNSHHNLLAALKSAEWVPTIGSQGLDAGEWDECPSCRGGKPKHKVGCQLAAAIAKAEGLNTTLADTRKNWTPNEWTGHTVISDGKKMTIRPKED